MDYSHGHWKAVEPSSISCLLAALDIETIYLSNEHHSNCGFVSPATVGMTVLGCRDVLDIVVTEVSISKWQSAVSDSWPVKSNNDK